MARRPGSKASAALWKNDDVARWRRCLASYESCVRAKKGTTPTQKHLVGDDRFWRTELPKSMRANGQLSHSDLSLTTRWKLARGKWRPTQNAVDSNSPKAVETATRAAIAALDRGQWLAALRKVSSLHGVGPATASAVLATYSPELAPFMADEAMEAVPGFGACSGNSQAYTEDSYVVFRDALVARAQELQKLGWDEATAEAVGRALWCAGMISINIGKLASKNHGGVGKLAAGKGKGKEEGKRQVEGEGKAEGQAGRKKRRRTVVQT